MGVKRVRRTLTWELEHVIAASHHFFTNGTFAICCQQITFVIIESMQRLATFDCICINPRINAHRSVRVRVGHFRQISNIGENGLARIPMAQWRHYCYYEDICLFYVGVSVIETRLLRREKKTGVQSRNTNCQSQIAKWIFEYLICDSEIFFRPTRRHANFEHMNDHIFDVQFVEDNFDLHIFFEKKTNIWASKIGVCLIAVESAKKNATH